MFVISTSHMDRFKELGYCTDASLEKLFGLVQMLVKFQTVKKVFIATNVYDFDS